jgi:type VI secretion system protein ImpA
MSRLDPAALPQELFAPLEGSNPCGEPVRYDRAYRLIQEAREADDPNLPMGDWDRPLKRADWKQVANRCQEVLSTRCKDLQVCAWLTEAWIHLHGVSGLIGGLQLMLRLCSDYWPTLHPMIEDDDDAARVAPFTWMNENLAHTISLHTVLLTMPQSSEQITVATWDEALRNDNDSRRKSENEHTAFRLEIISAAMAMPSAQFVQITRDATDALAMLDALDTLLNDKLGSDGPSVARLRNMLHTLRNILQELRPDVQTTPAPIEAPAPEDDHLGTQAPINTQSDTTMDSDVPNTAPATTGPIRSREDAYQRLAEVAEYLQRTEPHSPTPYLIQRAVQWGKMSLADLVQESLRDEGDLLRLYSMLGMRGGRNGE